MKLILKLLIATVSILVAGYIIPGVQVASFFTALVVAIVLGVLNTFIKPIIMILALPINILTLGLFTVVINTGMILLTDKIVSGFVLPGFWIALVFGFVMWMVNSFLSMFLD
ncbi:phage holin family protein [candidate division WWE3 bacterium]|nr:phage holin family protein [candidate division WWE3 bacterium]